MDVEKNITLKQLFLNPVFSDNPISTRSAWAKRKKVIYAFKLI